MSDLQWQVGADLAEAEFADRGVVTVGRLALLDLSPECLHILLTKVNVESACSEVIPVMKELTCHHHPRPQNPS